MPKYIPNPLVREFKIITVGPTIKAKIINIVARPIFAFDRNLIPLSKPLTAEIINKTVTVTIIIILTVVLIGIPNK